MKIGYIGGVKHKNNREVITGYHNKDLKWEVQAERPPKPPTTNGGTVTYFMDREFDIYELKILKKGGELKFFYVLSGLTKEEIREHLDECWDLSTSEGFDFD